MDKVMRTNSDKELKGERTAEEKRQSELALKPLSALPEELILFQRVLTLFRGARRRAAPHRAVCLLRSCLSPQRNIPRADGANPLPGLCTKHSVSLNMIAEFAPFAEHALRSVGTFPAALEPPAAAKPPPLPVRGHALSMPMQQGALRHSAPSCARLKQTAAIGSRARGTTKPEYTTHGSVVPGGFSYRVCGTDYRHSLVTINSGASKR